MQCDQVAPHLDEVAAGQRWLEGTERDHVEQCLRCQAELAQYRRLLRALRTLRHEVVEPAPGLLGDLLAAVDAAGQRRAIGAVLRGRRVAYAGGIAAAATAAAAGGVIVLASRSRRRMGLAG